jgi:predicted CoA-binding protein
MNLHYMNLAFAALGYRIFTVYPPSDGNPISGKSSFVMITKRAIIEPNDQILAFRISETVFLESNK